MIDCGPVTGEEWHVDEKKKSFFPNKARRIQAATESGD